MFCGCRPRATTTSPALQGTNVAVESCDLGCEVCGYNWYEAHKSGDKWWNQYCVCCRGSQRQQDACKKMCVRQWPVILYDGTKYTGAAVGIDTEGTYDFCKKTLAKNDTIQSVKVAPGWKVTLVKHCAGETPNPELVLLESSPNLGEMNRQTSVVKVEKVLPRYFLITADTCPSACAINWTDAKGNILFHFNPRLRENAVVMNTNTNGSWGPEERIKCDVNGFSDKQSVFIWIVVTVDGFEVRNAAGAKLHQYKHRLPWITYSKFVANKLRCEETKGQKCFGFGNYNNDKAIVEAPLEVNIRQMDYTVSGWAKPSSYKYGILFSKDRSGIAANQLRFEIHPQGNVALATHGVPNGSGFAAPSHDPNNWGWGLTSPAALPIGVWTHVAAVRQGKVMRLYINGVRVGEVTSSDVYDHNSQHKMRVGCRYAPGSGNAGGDFFPGHLKGWKYWWNRAMSDAEIQAEAMLPAGPVVLFDGMGYTGAAVAIDKPGTYDYCKKTLAKNDTIQSVFVAPGWKATLFKHCAGETPNPIVELFSSSPNLGVMNKETSIVKVEAVAWQCITPRNSMKGQYVPVAINGAGDVECLSTDAKGCIWKGSLADCVKAVADTPVTSVKPLICGAPHKAIYGGPGYGESGHWCQVTKDAEWRCMTPKNSMKGQWVAVHTNLGAGDVECLSTDARSCIWKGSQADCAKALADTPPSSIKPLVCGAPHKAIYGGPGYGETGHWCQVTKDGN